MTDLVLRPIADADAQFSPALLDTARPGLDSPAPLANLAVAGARPLDPSTRTLRRFLMLAIATMPILVPAGPGNTAVADVTMLLFAVAAVVWLARRRVKARLPYAVGAWLMMVAGAVAAYTANSLGSALAVVQDGFVLVWAAMIACAVSEEPALLAAFRAAWAWSGFAAATILVTGKLLGLDWLAGVSPRDGSRAALSFGDPNMAGNYLLACLFVVLATRYPRNAVVRRVGVGIVVIAILYTGSNGALVGVIAGLAVAGVIKASLRRGVPFAAACAAALVLSAGAVVASVDLAGIRQWAADSGPVLRDGIGRSDDSSYAREKLVSEAMGVYYGGTLLGVGPGRTKVTLANNAAPYVKEAHNDFTATLVERGVIGAVGLIVLIGAVGFRLGRVTKHTAPGLLTDLVPKPYWLLALGAACLISGTFYEVLHFRHLWAFLGLVAGLELAARSSAYTPVPRQHVPEGRL